MPLLDEDDCETAYLLASFFVQGRREQGLDEATIRRKVVAVGVRAFNKSVADQVKQESWLAEFERQVDLAIEETRP